MSQNGSGLRSERWFGSRDVAGLMHRAALRTVDFGFPRGWRRGERRFAPQALSCRHDALGESSKTTRGSRGHQGLRSRTLNFEL